MKLKLEKHNHLHEMVSPFVLVSDEGEHHVIAVFDAQFAGRVKLEDVYRALAANAPPPLDRSEKEKST